MLQTNLIGNYQVVVENNQHCDIVAVYISTQCGQAALTISYLKDGRIFSNYEYDIKVVKKETSDISQKEDVLIYFPLENKDVPIPYHHFMTILMLRGNPIKAIKHIREVLHIGLKEAKDVWEQNNWENINRKD